MSKTVKYHCNIDTDDFMVFEVDKNDLTYFEIFNYFGSEETSCAVGLTRKQVVDMIAKIQSILYD